MSEDEDAHAAHQQLQNQPNLIQPVPQILQHVPFPSKLDFKDGASSRKSDWESFLQVWQNYEISSLLCDHPTERRTATLLTCFAPSALKVFNSLHFNDEAEKKNIDSVLDKMSRFCVGQVNETYERYMFNTRQQGTAESIDEYYTSLLELSRTAPMVNFAILS